MAEKSKILTRRTMLAGMAGGAAVVAFAQTKNGLGTVTNSFSSAFRSPYLSLARADHTVWSAEVGKTLTSASGATLKISSVETFAAYGDAEGLIRPRAFLVNFETTRGSITGDMIHSLTHKTYGTFDLYLVTSPRLRNFAQAVFN